MHSQILHFRLHQRVRIVRTDSGDVAQDWTGTIVQIRPDHNRPYMVKLDRVPFPMPFAEREMEVE